MLGTWRWNAAFGITGLGLTVLFSIGSNPLTVVLLNSLYAFIAFFLLGYGARFALAMILKPPAILGEANEGTEQTDGKGSKLDLTTPDEGENLNDLLKSGLQGGAAGEPQASAQKTESGEEFRPLAPPQFVNTSNKQPDELAKALRHLTGE